jgi:hypothetical protein
LHLHLLLEKETTSTALSMTTNLVYPPLIVDRQVLIPQIRELIFPLSLLYIYIYIYFYTYIFINIVLIWTTIQSALSSNINTEPSTELILTPKPAWVIKVLRSSGDKIFINMTENEQVPYHAPSLSLGFNKWPFMVLSPSRSLRGTDDGEVAIYDSIVHPQAIALCAKDTAAKDAVSGFRQSFFEFYFLI